MSRALTRCQACRHQILDTFAALAGISIKPSHYTRTATPIQQHIPITRRAFHISARYSEVEIPRQQKEEDSTSTTTPPAPSSQPTQDTNIPWYLQVETPTPPAPLESSPILALQEIPPLPSNPPQILLPILTHLSTSIGLDNLSLIDLRDVHPPPALGANLIMILGTARSYKHLNTSADRFCRYLRSKYKLSPYADGLLGRNELKLKLRRKARRMKLAQSVGNTVAIGEGSDDGITTGWVCVNVGSVENARIPEDEDEQAVVMSQHEQEELQVDEESYENPVDDGYIGFGSRSLAPRIVVQMFTEEKRLELDLEGLWDFRKEKRGIKSDRTDAEIREKARTSFGRNHVEGDGEFKPWAR